LIASELKLYLAAAAAMLLLNLLPQAAAQPGPGHALSFNGSNYVIAAPTGSVSGTFTVEAWVNPARTNGAMEIFSTRAPGEFSFDMQVDSGFRLHGDIGNGSSWLTTSADASFAYTSNQWFHVAYVVGPNSYTIYANGQQVGSGSFPSSTPLLYDNAHPITIGAWTPANTLFNGKLDEVRVWSVARSQAQIQAQMSARLIGSEPGLQAYYRFDEQNMVGVTTRALDSSGHGHHGTPVNRPRRVRSGLDGIVPDGVNPWTNECHLVFNDPGAGLPPDAVYSGGSYYMALRADRSLFGWGTPVVLLFVMPASATNIVTLAAAGNVLALRANGTILGWDSTSELNIPSTATNVVAVAAGSSHSLALRADGQVLVWGSNSSNQTNIPPDLTNVVAIAANNNHSLAVKSDGTVVAWGLNTFGQTNVPPSATNVIAVTAGSFHNAALRADGTVIAWGIGGFGRTNVPAHATNIVAISAATSQTLALRADGTVIAWGSSGLTNVPADLTNVVAIAAGSAINTALRADGAVIQWGDDSFLSIPANAVTTPIPLSTNGTVNTNVPGTYFITYTATNAGTVLSATRTVVVRDSRPAVITLNGSNPVLVARGSTYVDAGAVATDLCAGDLTSSLVVGSIDTIVPGPQLLSFTVTDSGGNVATTNRIVVVTDRPGITNLSTTISTNTVTGARTLIFRATILPNGSNTTARFEYGGVPPAFTVLSPDITIPGTVLASNMTLTNVFSFGATYYWRAVAFNSLGGTASPNQVVTLPSPYKPGDLNGDGVVSQSEFALVYSNYLPTSPWLYMTNVVGLGETNVTFALSNSTAGTYSVEYSTNLTSWELLGPAMPRYLFADPNATNGPQRYYRLRWP
jgi:alpha-tubulin suppressor-like RCC1 family protein